LGVTFTVNLHQLLVIPSRIFLLFLVIKIGVSSIIAWLQFLLRLLGFSNEVTKPKSGKPLRLDS
jgi:hypothetical protein